MFFTQSPSPPQLAVHCITLILCSLLHAAVAAPPAFELPSGDASIRGETAVRRPSGPDAGAGEPSTLVITTSARFAGAISSLTWRGKEFIDSADHGRELQSAINLDSGGSIAAETFNPTEAGTRRDGAKSTSSSRLLHLRVEPGALQTVSQMAFWLAPGDRSGPNLARNDRVLSDILLTKRVWIGAPDLPQVVRYDVTFSLPIGEVHQQAVFEALTGYMPEEFERFWRWSPTTRQLEPLDDGPGEIPQPVALATASGTDAMGIFAYPASGAIHGPTYGRFRFSAQKVVKWNCVFRLRDPRGIAPGEFPFRMAVVVGTLKEVEQALSSLQPRMEASDKPSGNP